VNTELEPAAELMIKDLDELIKDAEAEGNIKLKDHIVNSREHAFLIEVDTGRLLFEGKKEYAKKIQHEFLAFDKTLKAAEPELHTNNERRLYKELKALRTKYEAVYEAVLRDQLQLTEMMDVEMPKYSAIIIKDTEK
jgi:N12 class adenine-specific DNA methylase